jgi:hypothetical protein
LISTTFAFAPAGVPGSGSADARPYLCAAALPALLPPAADVRGTRVPTGMVAPRLRGWAAQDTGTAAEQLIRTKNDPNSQNDGTTPLGDHSSRRPLS